MAALVPVPFVTTPSNTVVIVQDGGTVVRETRICTETSILPKGLRDWLAPSPPVSPLSPLAPPAGPTQARP